MNNNKQWAAFFSSDGHIIEYDDKSGEYVHAVKTPNGWVGFSTVCDDISESFETSDMALAFERDYIKELI